MDISLFTLQLNQILETEENHLEKICDLLRAHTKACVYIKNSNGSVMVECLEEAEIECKSFIKTGYITLRRRKEFNETEKLAVNIALCLCTILIRHREEMLSAEKKRRANAVRAIINSLSFSELEAATHIIKTTTDGLLIAGHIADKLGFTRSVITSALRKLEGANLIETRSLGMKGTYIRVKDVLLSEELAKL